MINDKNLLWDELNLQKKGVVCQEKSTPRYGSALLILLSANRAMRGNRHPVTDTGIGHLIKIIGENMRRRIKAGEFNLLERGEETVYRRKTRKVEVLFERDRTKGYYGYRVIVNLDEEKKVPIKIQIYDWDDQLVESYGYENLDLNAGLMDADFDPKNPKYRF